MRRVEYLRALEDQTWDTVVVEVPSLQEDPDDGIDFNNLSESDIDVELLDYSNSVLSRLETHRKVALFAVYNSEVTSNPISKITGTEHDDKCENCEQQLTEENLVEGDLGFYCSEDCCEESELGVMPYREDFHTDG